MSIMAQLTALAVEKIKEREGITDPAPEVIVTPQNTIEVKVALSDFDLTITTDGQTKNYSIKLEQFILGQDVELEPGLIMQWKDD